MEDMHVASEADAFLKEAEFDVRGRQLFQERSNVVHSSRCCTRWKLYSPLFVVFATSLLWGFIIVLILYNPLSTSPDKTPFSGTQSAVDISTSSPRVLTCGITPAEAKSKDCVYDILSNHWVPRACMDQEAIEEYQTDGTWFGFANENQTGLLTIDAMSNMEFYYTNERDHIVHCAMLWRKQFRAFSEGRTAMDSIILDSKHTTHCSQFLMDMSDNGPDYRSMPIKTWVGIAACHIW